jgi:protein-L-isoaspartate O-methyltransferase
VSQDAFAHYAARACATDDPTLVAGRYGFQREAEARIAPDVMSKLAIGAQDTVLDIGGGPGTVAIPMARVAREVWVVDNERALALLTSRAQGLSNLKAVRGPFESVDLGRRFDKILIYSVCQYVPDVAALHAFIGRAASLLAPGGRLLVGDMPNASKKARFTGTRTHEEVMARWREDMASDGATEAARRIAAVEPPAPGVPIDDAVVLGLATFLRAQGYEAYVLPQSPDLPYGNTREDLLAVAWL